MPAAGRAVHIKQRGIAMLNSVLDPLVSTWVSMLSESINIQSLEGRGMLAYAVKVVVLVNREARDLWRAEARAPYLLAYCNCVFGSGHRARYLDGLPLNTLSQPPLVSSLYQIAARKTSEVFDIHKARANRALRIEKDGVIGERNSLNAVKYPAYPVPDLPVAVRSLIEHVESQHRAFELHASYTRSFRDCQRVGCTRPALLQAPDTELEASSDAEYWSCCRDGRTPAPDACLPSDMAFCSHGCFSAANSEFESVVSFEIITPECQTRRGANPTPSRLFRAALSRNSGIERTLLRSPARLTIHYPSKLADRERLLRDRITMLSVDAGVLYAAMVVAELPPRLKPRRQLPCSDNWRARAACYLGAVCRVRALYLQHGGGMITKTGNEQWLRKVKDVALRVF